MELQTAKGVRDIPPEEKTVKNQVVRTIQEVFELYGFLPLETPILERYETLTAKFAAGEASDALKETFKLKDQGGRDLGLRFDLTVPLARYIAMNPMLKLPFKRYEMGPVFRDGPIKLGRYREFWQCDVDVIGSSSLLAEAELLAVVQAVFNKLNLDVVIKVNSRKILNGLLEQAGILKKEEAIVAIDKLDKIGKEGVQKELEERGYQKKQIASVLSLLTQSASLLQLKKKLTAAEAQQGIKEMEELFSYLSTMGVKKAVFDISLARGLAYYTGAVYEAYLRKGPITSSLAAGGRWDAMIGKFLGGGREIPAVGVAFGLEPIMDTLQLQKKKESVSPTKIYVVPINTTLVSLKIAQQLREAGIPTSFALKNGVSKNLEYASAGGLPFALIIGEDELQKKKVLLRDMKTGREQLTTVKQVIEQCRKRR